MMNNNILHNALCKNVLFRYKIKINFYRIKINFYQNFSIKSIYDRKYKKE